MKRIKSLNTGTITISTSVSKELHERCVINNISWAECIRIGATQLLSKMDDAYLNRIQLERANQELAVKLQHYAQENWKIKEKLNKIGVKDD